MPVSPSTVTLAAVADPSARVVGTAERYTLTGRPRFHAEDDHPSFAGLYATVAVTIRLPGRQTKPGEVRSTLCRVVAGPVRLTFPGLRFAGYVDLFTFDEVIGPDGSFAGGSVALTVTGQEE